MTNTALTVYTLCVLSKVLNAEKKELVVLRRLHRQIKGKPLYLVTASSHYSHQPCAKCQEKNRSGNGAIMETLALAKSLSLY